MDPSIIYAIIVSGLLFLFCLRGISNLAAAVLSSRQVITFLCTYLYRRFFHRLSYLSAMIQFSFWAITIAFNFIGVSSLSEGGSRAGSLAIFSFIPLFMADRLGFTADIMDLPLRTVLQMHKSVGVMAILQTAAHITLKCLSGDFKLKDSKTKGNFYGLMVSFPLDSGSGLTTVRPYRQLLH
jgi:hypothetical protein